MISLMLLQMKYDKKYSSRMYWVKVSVVDREEDVARGNN